MSRFDLLPEDLERYREIQRAKGRADLLDSVNASVSEVTSAKSSESDITSIKNDKCGEPRAKAQLGKLLAATDLRVLFGDELWNYGRWIQVFKLLARTYRAGATGYHGAAAMLRNPSCPLRSEKATGPKASKVAVSVSSLCRAVHKLEKKFNLVLVRSSSSGRDGLTEAGMHLAELIETFN